MHPLKMCDSTLFTWCRLNSLVHNSRASWCLQALLPRHSVLQLSEHLHRSSNMSSTVRPMCFVQYPLCLGWSIFLNYQNSSRGFNLASASITSDEALPSNQIRQNRPLPLLKFGNTWLRLLWDHSLHSILLPWTSMSAFPHWKPNIWKSCLS